MKHISNAMPRYISDVTHMPEAEYQRLMGWWTALNDCVMDEGLDAEAVTLRDVLPLYRAGYGPEAAMHEIADRRSGLVEKPR